MVVVRTAPLSGYMSVRLDSCFWSSSSGQIFCDITIITLQRSGPLENQIRRRYHELVQLEEALLRIGHLVKRRLVSLGFEIGSKISKVKLEAFAASVRALIASAIGRRETAKWTAPAVLREFLSTHDRLLRTRRPISPSPSRVGAPSASSYPEPTPSITPPKLTIEHQRKLHTFTHEGLPAGERHPDYLSNSPGGVRASALAASCGEVDAEDTAGLGDIETAGTVDLSGHRTPAPNSLARTSVHDTPAPQPSSTSRDGQSCSLPPAIVQSHAQPLSNTVSCASAFDAASPAEADQPQLDAAESLSDARLADPLLFATSRRKSISSRPASKEVSFVLRHRSQSAPVMMREEAALEMAAAERDGETASKHSVSVAHPAHESGGHADDLLPFKLIAEIEMMRGEYDELQRSAGCLMDVRAASTRLLDHLSIQDQALQLMEDSLANGDAGPQMGELALWSERLKRTAGQGWSSGPSVVSSAADTPCSESASARHTSSRGSEYETSPASLAPTDESECVFAALPPSLLGGSGAGGSVVAAENADVQTLHARNLAEHIALLRRLVSALHGQLTSWVVTHDGEHLDAMNSSYDEQGYASGYRALVSARLMSKVLNDETLLEEAKRRLRNTDGEYANGGYATGAYSPLSPLSPSPSFARRRSSHSFAPGSPSQSFRHGPLPQTGKQQGSDPKLLG